MSNSFGENIKKYRSENGLSQGDFADELSYYIQQHSKKTDFDYSGKSISKWERGDALPSLEIMIAVSSLLEISLDELLKTDIENFSKSLPASNDIYSLSKKNKKLLYDLLQIDFQFDEKTETYYVLFDICLRFNKNDATLICAFGENLSEEKSFAWSQTEIDRQMQNSSILDIVERTLKKEIFADLIEAKVIKNISCSDSHKIDSSIDNRYTDSAELYIVQTDLGMTSDEIVEFLTQYVREKTIARLDCTNGTHTEFDIFEWNDEN